MEQRKTEAQKRLEEAFNTVASTESGKTVLQWIMRESGFQDLNASVDPTRGLLINSLVYNEGRRSVYVGMRQFIDPDLLSAIEKRGK